MSRNLHWTDANSARAYPLDDTATAAAHTGQRLPPTILADLSLRYPLALGDWPFLASITVGDSLVSLTIQCAADPDDPATFAPVAAVSLPRSAVQAGRHYPLQAQYPGVGGWVVFGDGVDDVVRFGGRFAARAGLLAPRAARAYRPLPVTSLAKLHSDTPLSGVVNLLGEEPVKIVKERRTINGVDRDVAVIRLVSASGENASANTDNLFEAMAGPCGQRPESGNCGPFSPIEFLNAVPPDCDGNITIEFRGCATIAQVLGECGIVLDCELGLNDVCTGKTLPDAQGHLRTEYPDQCAASEPASESASESASDSPATPHYSESISESETVLRAELPYTASFDDVAELADWQTQGVWSVDGGSATTAGGAASRNLALYAGVMASSLNKRYATTVTLATASGKRNGGLVINYRPVLATPNRYAYYLVEIDYDEKRFRIMRFNGNHWVPEPAYADLPGLKPGVPYDLAAEVTPGAGDTVQLVATIAAASGPALSATITLNTRQFLPDIGLSGLHVNRAVSRFDVFTVEDL